MLINKTVEDFLDTTASKEPIPGGGSIAALSGAVAAALIEMVANLTIGKKKYSEVEEEMREVAKEALKARWTLQEAIQKDADSFDQVMEAFRLPKITEVEKQVRQEVINKAMIHAMEVPLEVALIIESLFPLAKAVVIKGNKNAATDAAVATMHLRTGILSALYNVKINLNSLEMNPKFERILETIKKLEKSAVEKEAEILKLVKLD